MNTTTTPATKLRIEEIDHTLVMRINRPEAQNAIDIDILRALAEAYTRLSASPDLHCGVLCANGNDFTCGLDLPATLPRMVAEGASAYLNTGQCDPLGLFGPFCAKPVVVAAHGRCYTAGLELALAADVFIAAKGTTFRQHEVTRGIFPFGGATWRLPQAIGWHHAMRYILAGDSFDADAAWRLGLIQQLSEPGQHIDDALAIAQRIGSNAPLGVQAALANARIPKLLGLDAAIDDLVVSGRRIAASQDAIEGVMSMIERRAAVFRGC